MPNLHSSRRQLQSGHLVEAAFARSRLGIKDAVVVSCLLKPAARSLV